ncbi:MAG: ATP synthase subunit I [Pseudohongiellaceae bacterium]
MKPPPVHKVIIAQISATTFIAVVSLVLINASTAFSVLLGGGVSSGSNAFFAAQAFKHRGARNAQKIVKGFLAGEIGKFCITVVMFALSFSLLPNVVEVAMILAFLIVHVVGVAAAVRIDYTPNGHKSTPSPREGVRRRATTGDTEPPGVHLANLEFERVRKTSWQS